ncbi:MAG TPA: enoyl-CoA hydratase-related protein [Chloroflexota bacterium]|nr:enoyl-CoA hydratase-related protein [Chloroflexota bacterium]
MAEMTDIIYRADGPVAVITMNRPRYHNAQSYPMLDGLDQALTKAMQDPEIRVAIVTGAGPHFSSGHDLGTPEQVATREERKIPAEGLDYYDSFRLYNFDYNLKWRTMPKPTIAMVRGYCIFGGWMIASSMDLVFADETAQFLSSQFEYFSLPWDVGPRKAKELIFESRFIDGEEAMRYGFVNRVYGAGDLERETIGYAKRVAQTGSYGLRMSKIAVNHAQDIMGYTTALEAGFADYMTSARTRTSGPPPRVPGARRQLGGVDLALRGERGERPGQPNET